MSIEDFSIDLNVKDGHHGTLGTDGLKPNPSSECNFLLKFPAYPI